MAFMAEPQAHLALPDQSQDLGDVLRSVLEEHGIAASDSRVSEAEASAPVSSPSAHRALQRADLLIADITGKRPNVMFEVGMAVGMGKQVLLLSRDRDVPADLAAHEVVVYKPGDVSSVRRYLELWLRDTARRVRSESR
jgi:nucleoside 2-deoxyribosyltransferase